jgi:hypothetical protein
VVWVVVDHDVIVVPIPVVNVRDIKRGDAEVVPAKPEATRAAASEPPDIARPKASFEVAVFPRMFQVESDVVPALIVSDPFAVLVNVRSLRMALLIAEGWMISRRMIPRRSRCVLHGNGAPEIVVISGRSAARDIAAADSVTGPFSVIFASSAVAFMLGEEGKGRYE